MSDLIQQFPGRTIQEWEQWYTQKHPKAIQEATRKVYEMVENFKEVILKIDEDMAKDWVRDLVVLKTFTGLRFQEAILKKVSECLQTNCRRSTAEEESKGIDGYIGDTPVSIKPHTYKAQSLSISEQIDVSIIYYDKKKTGLTIEYDL